MTNELTYSQRPLHTNYKRIIIYRKSEVIYEGTTIFCRRFITDQGDPMVKHMLKTALSCKQNIIDGSSVANTSKEAEMRHTDLAKANVEELIEDYQDYLAIGGKGQWQGDDRRLSAARSFAHAHNDWKDWEEIFTTKPASALANMMLTICHQTRYMLGKMLEFQQQDYQRHCENLERAQLARGEFRPDEFGHNIYSFLAGAPNCGVLDEKAKSLRMEIIRIISTLKRQRGWVA